MKKIGLFLAMAPEQSISAHGIGRLIGFILSGLLKNQEITVVIAIPGWYKKLALQFLQEQSINMARIELLSTSGMPYLLRIRNFIIKLVNRPRKPGLLARLYQFSNVQGLKILTRLLAISSTPVFIGSIFLLLATAIILLPFILVITVLHIFLRILRFLWHQLRRLKFPYIAMLTHPLRFFKNHALANSIYLQLRSIELDKLIKKINKRKDIPTWFVPTLFWPEIAAIKAKKIVAAPDIVFTEFPTCFPDSSFILSYHIIKKTMPASDHFICYSEHVKQKHLVEAFNIHPEKISVIQHGATDLNDDLNKNLTALEILQAYQKKALQDDAYLRNYDFSQTRFIFYSSQIRPHKNFMHLIQAYEILLRKRFLNIKLIVTATFKDDSPPYHYIMSKRLRYDIISLPNVPPDVLAALNRHAVCAVNPSLFEGGFPFTFSEAYSVGTPSVMSAIPVVTEVVNDPILADKMLFNPYDKNDMVNKIAWAIENRDELYQLQQPLYQKLNQRSWEVVANEYVQLFKKVANNAVIQ